jgi:hypothetical protein
VRHATRQGTQRPQPLIVMNLVFELAAIGLGLLALGDFVAEALIEAPFRRLPN